MTTKDFKLSKPSLRREIQLWNNLEGCLPEAPP